MSWERVYLLRHGETEWNQKNLFRGRADVPLSERGIEQAQSAARGLMAEGINAIYTSPVPRAKQTAEIVGEILGVPVMEEPSLTDPDVGEWEGMEVGEVGDLYADEFRILHEHTSLFAFPGGESVKQVARRAGEFVFNELEAKEGRLLLVTHNFICQVLILCFLGSSLDNLFKVQHDHGSVTIFQRRAENIFLRTWNGRLRDEYVD